jgi:hypothetical protein
MLEEGATMRVVSSAARRPRPERETDHLHHHEGRSFQAFLADTIRGGLELVGRWRHES